MVDGDYALLPEQSMYSRYNDMERGDEVPPIASLRLGVTALEVDHDGLLVGRAREQAERRIAYEGIDTSDQDSRWRENLHLPGDLVRVDPSRRIVGVDHDALAQRVGSEPLEIARTVVEGVERDNTLGGKYQAALEHYEFKGLEGRFPAGAFQHERGEEHRYGVLLAEGEKLWFVPMSDDMDAPKPAGAPREVVSAVESSHVGSFDTMRDMVKDEPAAGEFVLRPEAFGRTEGPVELVGAPWMSSAGAEESALARAAVQVEPSLPGRGQPEALRAAVARSIALGIA